MALLGVVGKFEVELAALGAGFEEEFEGLGEFEFAAVGPEPVGTGEGCAEQILAGAHSWVKVDLPVHKVAGEEKFFDSFYTFLFQGELPTEVGLVGHEAVS